MSSSESRTIVVAGATGLQGGAVTRHLLSEGWQVRALTRNPQSPQARALAALGANVVQGDMDHPASLRPVFAGAYGAYGVQNPYISGIEGEIRQGRNLADIAKAEGVRHFVYGSAGIGRKGTCIPSWESKVKIEDHIRDLGLPVTILRPMAFMELMTNKKFYPQITAWHMLPTLAGESRKVPWLCTEDLGAIVARVFARPKDFIGQSLQLASDSQSVEECRNIYRAVRGKNPPRLPLPVWLFTRFGFIGKDLYAMYSWLRTGPIDIDPATTCSIHPGAMSVESWLRTQTA